MGRLISSPYSLRETLLWPWRLARPSLADPTGLGRTPRRWRASGRAPISARVLFIGDIQRMFGERLPEVCPELRALFARADLTVANLEGPLVFERMQGRAAWNFTFGLAEDYLLEFLSRLGLEPKGCLLSVANNHMGDHGPEGWARTRAALERLGLAQTGGTAATLAVRDLAGRRVGFAAWTRWENKPTLADGDRIWRRSDALGADWRARRAEVDVDLLAGLPHWGYEFEHFPRAQEREDARTLLSSGFDLLVGHHAHTLQGTERIGEGWCVYGVGNFYGIQITWAADLVGVLELELAPGSDGRLGLAAFELHPFYLWKRRPGPAFVTLEQLPPRLRQRCRDRLRRIYVDTESGP